MPAKMAPQNFVDNDFEGDCESDNEVRDEEHGKLLRAVHLMDNQQRIKPPSRSEPSVDISEFHLPKIQGSSVHLKALARSLERQGRAFGMTVAQKINVLNKKSKVLPKPLEKNETKKINRFVAYSNVTKQLGRWDAIVQTNRAARSIEFPLNIDPLHVENTSDLVSKWQSQSSDDLEGEINKLLGISKVAQEDKKEEQQFKLTLAELRAKRREMAKLRAQQSYEAAKAKRIKNIKSKKYHRIMRQEKMQRQLKEFEALQKTDPEAALKQLELLEKARAEERMTLRHKSTGQWARSKLVRAKYDPQTRMQLAEQLAKSRELTKKIKPVDSSDEDGGEDNDNPKEIFDDDIDNPWMTVKPDSEVQDFVSGYKKYWEEQNKKVKGKQLLNNATEKSSDHGNKLLSVNGHIEEESVDKETTKENDDSYCQRGVNSRENNAQDIEDVQRSAEGNVATQCISGEKSVVKKKKTNIAQRKKSDDSESSCFPVSDRGNSRNESFSSSSKEGLREDSTTDLENKKFSSKTSSAKDVVLCTKQTSSLSNMEPTPIRKRKKNNLAETKVTDSTKTTFTDGSSGESLSTSERLKSGVSRSKKSKQGDSSKNATKTNCCDAGNSAWNVSPLVKELPFDCTARTETLVSSCESSCGKDSSDSRLVTFLSCVNEVSGERDSKKKTKRKKKSTVDKMFEAADDNLSDRIQKKLEKLKADINSSSTTKSSDVRDNSMMEQNDLGVSLAMKSRKELRPREDVQLDEGSDDDDDDDSQQLKGLIAKASGISVVDTSRTTNGSDSITSKTSGPCGTTKNADSNSKLNEASINPNDFIVVKPKELLSAAPDIILAGDEALDNEVEGNQEAIIAEAFADDDVVDKFRKEKQDAIDSSAPKDIDLTLPGWGSWGGTGIVQRKKRRFFIKAPPAPPRRDDSKANVIIHEAAEEAIREHQVRELPIPFTSVEDFEASIRAPVGSTWIPQTAHQKLIQPAVITKMGKIITPLDEEFLVNKKVLEFNA